MQHSLTTSLRIACAELTANSDLILKKEPREESSIRSGLFSLHAMASSSSTTTTTFNNMHQTKHTSLFEPQLAWPGIDFRMAYGNIFVTNAYVKPFALLTKPKESLMT
jgi:hypothetical protein